MDTSDPDIEFDADGVCVHCRHYDERVTGEVIRGEAGRARLAAIAERMKRAGRGRSYDCLIGVSGGIDSTMAVSILRQLGLRVLAIHLDNGWNSELAVDNIKRMLEKLDVELYTHVIDWEEFKDLQLSFLKASVCNLEIPTDHAIGALHFKVASEQGIKYVVTGGNVMTEAFLPTAWSYDPRDLRHLKAIHRRFGSARLRSFPRLGIFRTLYYVFVRGIRWVSILNYADYDKREATRVLQEDFGWRPYGGKHYESVYTRFFQGYILPTKFGFDKRRAHLANLVLSGEMTRDQAIEELATNPYIGSQLWTEDRSFVTKKLGLTDQAFDELMTMPPKSHYDYPTHRFLFERLPSLFAVFKRLATKV